MWHIAVATFYIGFAIQSTANQPQLVKDISPGAVGSNISLLTRIGNTLFFRAGDDLWKSDGTDTGTILVRAGVKPLIISDNGGMAFFISGADNHLWKSDGTASGTVLVSTVLSTSVPQPLVSFNNRIFFGTYATTLSQYALFESDGTELGTHPVQDSSETEIALYPNAMTVFAGKLYFAAQLPPPPATCGGGLCISTPHTQLWSTDGSSMATIRLTLLDHSVQAIKATPHTLFFTTNNNTLFSYGTLELWGTDGEAGGERLLFSTAGYSYLGDLTVAGDTLFFIADDGTGGSRQLWKSDGTPEGTVKVSNTVQFYYDLYTYNNQGGTAFFEAVGSTLYFTALHRSTPSLQTSLWKTDGTSAGTIEIKQISPNISEPPRNLTSGLGSLLFTADDEQHGKELWQSNGTASGTTMVFDIRPGNLGAVPSILALVNGALFFIANDGITGTELWKYELSAITSPLSIDAPLSQPFSYTITANNNPVSFGAVGLPPGLTLNPATGVISGTPTLSGTFTITLTATDTNGNSVSGALTLTISPSGSVAVSVTVHAVSSTASPSPLSPPPTRYDDVDSPLALVPSETILKRNQPSLLGGLVADGVTPLLIQVDPNPVPTQPITFQISATVNGGSITGGLSQHFRVLQQPAGQPASFVTGSNVTLSASHPTGFAYISGIKSEDVQVDSPNQQLTVTLSATQGGSSAPSGTVQFKIRKPPVVLVHGFNSDNSTWGNDFLVPLQASVPADFILPVEYGVDRSNGSPNKTANRDGPFEYLATLLDKQLIAQVESQSSTWHQRWAFTRFNIVGHSQGGVLARMLCTGDNPASSDDPDFKPFRSTNNAYRGRFHRVITLNSPHNGSTLDYFELRLANEGYPVQQDLITAGILQEKFNPFGAQMIEINVSHWHTDPLAKFHLLGTTIYSGRMPPATWTSSDAPPLAYVLGALCYPVLGQNYSTGSVVLPQGSDGVVDFASEFAGFANGTKTSSIPGVDIAHADIAPRFLFGVQQDTDVVPLNTSVANRIAQLLDGSSSNFAPFFLQPLASDLQSRIDAVIPACFINNNLIQSSNTSMLGGRAEASASGQVYQYRLAPASGQELRGLPNWTVQVFGPNGVTSDGVTITPDDLDPTRVSIIVGADVVGDVVLSVNYSDTSGDLIVGGPILVVSHPPGTNITGLDLRPDTVSLPVGSSVASELWANYDNGNISSRLYVPANAIISYSSSDDSIAGVDGTGKISFNAVGTANITVSYQGLTAESSITVIAPPGHPVFAAQLANISTRLSVGTGDNVLIGGFIIAGSQPKKVIVRAIGPALASAGLTGLLADPTLELHDGTGALIATNDNWQTTQIGGIITASQVSEIQNSGLAPTQPAESAIVAALSPGVYTAIVRGKNNATGVGLVEGYDVSSTSDSKLANISTRGFVQTGDNVMIGGLIVQGIDPARVIVRAIGPSLSQAGITNPLLDPTLELHDGNGALLTFNDNWRNDQQAEIQATGLAPNNNAESAILATLSPGVYTAIVRGKNDTSGIALVEAYQLGN
jgi:ELWxxDGT repeat protein